MCVPLCAPFCIPFFQPLAMPAHTLSSSPTNARDGSDGQGDVSAAAAHAIVCDFVTAQAASSETAASSGWASYCAVFLSAEVQDLIRARLAGDGQDGAADADGDSSGGVDQGGPQKKRKLDPGPAPVADVSWTVYCLDGATFSVVVPEQARVAEIKRTIATLRAVPCFTMELFVEDVEEPLDDERRVGLADRVPLFLLTKCPSDRLALEAFFKSTGGANWTNKTGWMTDAELGDWHGVTVDEEGRVTTLDLRGNGLAGPLPSDMQQLSALQRLDLFNNQLTGPIPAELGQLGALQGLSLDKNQLSGPIPAELGQLGALLGLFLNDNQLTGPIPAELAQMGALMYLLLSSNQLSGPIPAVLCQMGALQDLRLGANLQLTGQEAFQGHMQEHRPDCALAL